jgi:hypothetical protein
MHCSTYLRSLLLICICMFGITTHTHSQVFENDAGQREALFRYKVLQIEEFFNRYNNDTASFIWQEYRKSGVPYKIKRTALIRSLFNYVTRSWPDGAIDSFVKKALQVKMPSNGNFYGDNWFAEIICRFNYNNSVIDIPVILRYDMDRYKGSKWIITGVKQTLFSSAAELPVMSTSVPEKFISPAGNGSDFAGLARVFADRQNLSAYFDQSFFQKNNATGFYHAILKNQLKFLSTKEIRYHFLQVNNYIFTVQYFERKSKNAGWLINNLTPASAADKQHFRKELLGAQ